jgi:hypothetical protein
MSTSETDEYKIGTCPCGKGAIIRTMITQDNPWSSADISHRIECDACRGEWELSRSGDRLTLRSSTITSQQAGKVQMSARHDLDVYVRGLAAKHYAAQKFNTKKAEHAYLVGHGIAVGSYRTYLEDRRRSPMHGIGYFHKSDAFVNELVVTYGDKAHYETLVAALADSEAASKAASAKIVRQPVKL